MILQVNHQLLLSGSSGKRQATPKTPAQRPVVPTRSSRKATSEYHHRVRAPQL